MTPLSRSRVFPPKGMHPAAWQSHLRGCPGMACSAASRGFVFHAARVVRCAVGN